MHGETQFDGEEWKMHQCISHTHTHTHTHPHTEGFNGNPGKPGSPHPVNFDT